MFSDAAIGARSCARPATPAHVRGAGRVERADPAPHERRGHRRRHDARISARELFDQLKERLGLRWVAGLRGETRVLEAGETLQRRPSLVGYLNIIYPNKVQIIGTEELRYLDGLDSRQRWETMAQDHRLPADRR